MPWRQWALVASALLLSVPYRAQSSALSARLNEIASSYTAKNAFMGSVLVAQGDQVLLDRGYGSANLEWHIPNAPDVEYRLGSLTKQFTATLILLLRQDGKLKIEDPVSKYLPDAPASWQRITLAELLGHTSGIANFTSLKDFRTWSMAPHTIDEELAFFRDVPLEFEPGSRYAYSNSNYEVLGAIIEKVGDRRYATLLRERILNPLDMKATGVDRDDLVLPRRAAGYVPGLAGLSRVRSESMSVPWAAGSIYSTTGDLLKWERGLFGGQLLSAESLRLMTTPGQGDYGLGVLIRDRGGLRVITHNGAIEGFNTYLAYVPERRITVAVLANVSGSAPDTMGPQLLDTVLGRAVILPTERKTVPIAAAQLAKFGGVFDLGPAESLTVSVSEAGLTVHGSGRPAVAALYQGVREGHPRFFIAPADAEIEFVPAADGSIASLILHVAGQDLPARSH